ncbi:MAG: lamin tail domain-containing protein [bacterium]
MLRPTHIAFLCFVVVTLPVFLVGAGRTDSTSPLHRLTNTSEEILNLNPSISGDGRFVVFESTSNPEGAGGGTGFHALRAELSAETATVVQLALSRAVAAAISQDGSRIAFASKDDPLGTNRDGNSEIFYYDGTALRQITETRPGEPSERLTQGNFQPSISDDGRLIAFSSNRDLTNQNPDANLEIFIIDIDTRAITQLTNSSGIAGCRDAKISGGGNRVAYIRDSGMSANAESDLILQDLSGAASVQIVAASLPALQLAYGRAISDHGERVVYSAETANHASQVFLFDGRRNTTRQITSLGIKEDDVALQATISGDGSRVAFATRRNVIGGNADQSVELYTFDIPSAQFERVTSASASATALVVSSLNDDGSLVAFNFPRVISGPVSSSNFANNSEIYVSETARRPPFGELTVLNAASLGKEPALVKAITPGSIAVARGNALSDMTSQSDRQPSGAFPLNLHGTAVTVNGRPAQVLFVSPTEVHFVVPAATELASGEVVVSNADGYRSRASVVVLPAAPGIFTTSGDGAGDGVILNADTLQSGPFDPSDGRLRLSIFCTGVRRGLPISARAGGQALAVESVNASLALPGLDEIHVVIPVSLRGAGTIELVVRSDAYASNPVRLTLTGGSARNVLLNEVLADPPDGLQGDANHDGVRSSSDDEFIELVNAEGAAANISGWTVRTRASNSTNEITRHTFAQNTLLIGGEPIVVFGGGAFDTQSALFGCAQVANASSGGLSLTNGGLSLMLRDASGQLITEFSYGGATGFDGGNNQSLTRAPDVVGNFVQHTSAAGADGRKFSAGTKSNGTPFGNCLGHLTSVTLSPPSVSVVSGQSTQFTAQTFDEFGRSLIPPRMAITSSNTDVATVDSVVQDPLTGITIATVMGHDRGQASISAQAVDGMTMVSSGPSRITVTPRVTRLEIAPASAAINRGDALQFTATAFDQNDQALIGVLINWSSSDNGIATIEANGLAHGVGIANVTITATTDSGTGTMLSASASLGVKVPLLINEALAQVPLDNAATAVVEGDANRDGLRSSDDDEFVELVNNSSAPVNIAGVVIADSTSHRFTFPENTVLAPGRAVIIFGGGFPPASDPAFGGALIFTTGSLSLGDNSDIIRVILPDANGEVTIDSLAYGAGNPVAAPGAQSLTRFADVAIGSAGGPFVPHTTAGNAAGRLFSPGTRSDGIPFGSLTLNRIEVTPAMPTLDIGASQTFTAQAFAIVGGLEIPVPNVAFVWDSPDAARVSLAPATGQTTNATALGAGAALIRATAGGIEGQALLNISSPFPTLSIDDVSLNEGNSGATAFTFNVSLSAPAPPSGVSFNIETADGTATTADQDYVRRSLSGETIPAGSLSYSFAIIVNGDLKIEPNETFLVNVSNLSGALPGNSQGVATIQNDDFGQLVITQIYGGGNNSGATFQNDFVELFNRGSSVDFSVTPYSIQYASAAGNFSTGNKLDLTTGTLLPGRYFLIRLAGGTTNGSPLPPPDVAQSSINMSATDGKVALVPGTLSLSGTGCPLGLSVTDFVGYGAANCAEGLATPALGATKSARRINSCSDSNSNSADFAVVTNPAPPRNSATASVSCPANVPSQ